MSDPKVPTLPPLSDISDASTQRALVALKGMMDVRNGHIGSGDEAFITKAQLKDLVSNNFSSLSNTYSYSTGSGVDGTGNSGAAGGGTNTRPDIGGILGYLQGSITESMLYKKLGDRIDKIDAPATGLITQVGKARAGIAAETFNRVNSDNVIVQAINTIWGVVGNSNALVQSGSSVTLNSYAAQADQWNQLQAQVGEHSTLIRQEATARADADGKLMAQYSVKIDQNGYVSGFGLSSETPTAGPTTSSFIVRADKFAIGSPSGPGITPKVPFIVTTTPISRPDGTTIQPGVYMDSAMVDSLYGTYINAGTLDAGTIYSGSQIVDRSSKQPILSTTATSWGATIINSVVSPVTWSTLRMYGPGWHSSVPVNQRVRYAQSGVNPVAFTIMASATIDHWFTIWARYNTGTWVPITTVQEPQSGYGSATAVISGTTFMDTNDYFDIGVSATDSSGAVWNAGASDIRYLTISVSVTNI